MQIIEMGQSANLKSIISI